MTLAADPTSPPLIMIIDDDDDACEFAELCLTKAGFHVRAFRSAEEALASLESAVPRVVVTDIALAGMDGQEAGLRLKLNPRTRQVPIVAVTGHSELTTSRSGTFFHCILVKPVSPESLVQTIRDLISLAPPN